MARRAAVRSWALGEHQTAYRSDLRVLAERIAGPGEAPALQRVTADQLTTAAIRGALADLARAGRAPASRNPVRSTTGSPCRWLVRRGLLEADPTVEIERPAQPRRLPVALTVAQLGEVLTAASIKDPAARRPWPERDRALVAVLAGAGVRASELCGADITDLLVDEDVALRVRGKGNKDRVVPLPQEVLAAVLDYLPPGQPQPPRTNPPCSSISGPAPRQAEPGPPGHQLVHPGRRPPTTG
jgi:integrase/recombinase XerC